MSRMKRYLHALCLDASERLGLCEALVVAHVVGALQIDWSDSLFYNYSIIVHSYIVHSYIVHRAVASGGAGGGAAAPHPPRGTLAPPRTFTGLITGGQLEHYDINT